MAITTATYRDARREHLIAATRYLSYAKREPARRDHFLGWRKNAQRHLAALRAAPRRPMRFA